MTLHSCFQPVSLTPHSAPLQMYVVKRDDLRKNMMFRETSLVKAESLYACYNAKLIHRINFLDIYVGERGEE